MIKNLDFLVILSPLRTFFFLPLENRNYTFETILTDKRDVPGLDMITTEFKERKYHENMKIGMSGSENQSASVKWSLMLR